LSNALAPWSPQLSLRDGNALHAQYQISVLIDGKPKAFNIPAELLEMLRTIRSRCSAVIDAAAR